MHLLIVFIILLTLLFYTLNHFLCSNHLVNLISRSAKLLDYWYSVDENYNLMLLTTPNFWDFLFTSSPLNQSSDPNKGISIKWKLICTKSCIIQILILDIFLCDRRSDIEIFNLRLSIKKICESLFYHI